MAVRASSELVIEAPPEAIMDALADIESVVSWSSLHKDAEIVDRHPDGRPHHVRATVKIMGLSDQEMLEYHWGDDWVVWDAEQTSRQRCQHGEYNLTPVGEERTRVRFDLILDLAAPYPTFLVRRAKQMVLDIALQNLRQRVLAATQ
ncbi:MULTISPECIES: SRPBCC family protein [Mycolicibacterium]|uniref:Polyketide cyclase / dehydrase family protein n=2 Tax=Mycolicibacterium gilvum TaxID=1804 RepID=E6TF93_MYCSR|nr:MULTISPECIES: SRPBCC family protein [Mycolicibacterium]ABP44161.1 cyclase/dehydrase [Mycolicibacterium gilvum PYR-GCK]ADT97746.1 polyketide cyclase / dehydrase family protein [Mycolicibacterium gilvum Spyr1]MBV5246535.1 SRPBCC family protein [Mycolicibacterium sp. PAM1]MCV7057894.1 SRPBCC family protein [Mycolicibacterium gilvum]